MRGQGNFGDHAFNYKAASQMSVEAPAAQRESRYVSPKLEGQWQWDNRDAPPRGTDYPQGDTRSGFQIQRSDSNFDTERKSNNDPSSQSRQERAEVGYEEKTLLQTVEGLEQKFLQDIRKLTKEQQDAEDLENARHRERLNKINADYQEKLVAMRARQAIRRDEFLGRESQARLQQYQQAGSTIKNYHSDLPPIEAHGFGSLAAAATSFGGTPHPTYGTGAQFDSYGQQSNFTTASESRGPYPGGRAYNAGGRRF